MTGIPLIPGEIPKEPLLKFTKRLSVLQGTLARLQPSFILLPRILITYTLSVVDYVFSAIPVQAEWIPPQQIQIKRIVCKALCIAVRTPNKMLWAGLDHMGFTVPHVFACLQRQYIKGLFLACNSRSTYTRETTRMLMLYIKPNVPPTQIGQLRNNGWPNTASPSTSQVISSNAPFELRYCTSLKATSSSCLTAPRKSKTMHGQRL